MLTPRISLSPVGAKAAADGQICQPPSKHEPFQQAGVLFAPVRLMPWRRYYQPGNGTNAARLGCKAEKVDARLHHIMLISTMPVLSMVVKVKAKTNYAGREHYGFVKVAERRRRDLL